MRPSSAAYARLRCPAREEAQRTDTTRWCGRCGTPLYRRDGWHEHLLLGSVADRRGWSPRSRPVSTLCRRITQDSGLQLAIDAGFAIRERRIDRRVAEEEPPPAEITGVFACGTAAVITPVAGCGTVPAVTESPTVSRVVTMALRDTLTGIQRGTFARHPRLLGSAAAGLPGAGRRSPRTATAKADSVARAGDCPYVS